MSLSTNLLEIPKMEFGLAGINTGNVISQELEKQGKGFKARYNPDTKKIVVLNTSDLTPEILSKILYEPSACSKYDSWRGYYPLVSKERDKDGNLEIELSQTKPEIGGSGPKNSGSISSTSDWELRSGIYLMGSHTELTPFVERNSKSQQILNKPSFMSLPAVDIEEPVSEEEATRMSKAISDGVINAMNQFFNIHRFSNEGIWYPNDYMKHLRDEFDAEMDQSYFTGHANDDFFEKTKRFTFKLREGKKASEALMSFLKGPTVADCGNATTACYYKSILDIIGEDKFNKAFGSESIFCMVIGQNLITSDESPISLLAEFTKASKKARTGVFGKRPLQIGDECHFDGVFWYENKHPEGFGGGWNVIYIGDDADGNQLFTAHGFDKPLTEKEINQRFIELYNCERTPQENQHIVDATNLELYDRQTNEFLKNHYIIYSEEAEKNPKNFIKGFLVGSIKNLNAREVVKLNKTKNISQFMINRQLSTLAASALLHTPN